MDNKLHIPRHVGALEYDGRLDIEESEFLDKHEDVLRRCLAGAFYIEELFEQKNEDLSSVITSRLLVKPRLGQVLRRGRLVRDVLNGDRFYITMYMPVIEVYGERRGYAEIRNIQSLFYAARKLFPDVKFVTDLQG